MESKNLTRVKIHLKADTPENLTKEMIKFNFKHNLQFEYGDGKKEGSMWYTWFFAPLDKIGMTKSPDESKPVKKKTRKKVSKK